MRNFNKSQDNALNTLAVAYANGDHFAGEEFVAIVQPMLRKYAYKQASPMEKEDLAAEFMVVAIEKCHDFAERYNDGNNNVMGLIYTACKRKLIDINRMYGTEKRSLYKDREVSLQALVGEDGDLSMSDKVSNEEKSVEETVIGAIIGQTVSDSVSDFIKVAKGRNAKIIPLVVQSFKNDWTPDELHAAIAEVLSSEDGKEPKPDAVRQAKSRALKAVRKAIESI